MELMFHHCDHGTYQKICGCEIGKDHGSEQCPKLKENNG